MMRGIRDRLPDEAPGQTHVRARSEITNMTREAPRVGQDTSKTTSLVIGRLMAQPSAVSQTSQTMSIPPVERQLQPPATTGQASKTKIILKRSIPQTNEPLQTGIAQPSQETLMRDLRQAQIRRGHDEEKKTAKDPTHVQDPSQSLTTPKNGRRPGPISIPSREPRQSQPATPLTATFANFEAPPPIPPRPGSSLGTKSEAQQQEPTTPQSGNLVSAEKSRRFSFRNPFKKKKGTTSEPTTPLSGNPNAAGKRRFSFRNPFKKKKGTDSEPTTPLETHKRSNSAALPLAPTEETFKDDGTCTKIYSNFFFKSGGNFRILYSYICSEEHCIGDFLTREDLAFYNLLHEATELFSQHIPLSTCIEKSINHKSLLEQNLTAEYIEKILKRTEDRITKWRNIYCYPFFLKDEKLIYAATFIQIELKKFEAEKKNIDPVLKLIYEKILLTIYPLVINANHGIEDVVEDYINMKRIKHLIKDGEIDKLIGKICFILDRLERKIGEEAAAIAEVIAKAKAEADAKAKARVGLPGSQPGTPASTQP